MGGREEIPTGEFVSGDKVPRQAESRQGAAPHRRGSALHPNRTEAVELGDAEVTTDRKGRSIIPLGREVLANKRLRRAMIERRSRWGLCLLYRTAEPRCLWPHQRVLAMTQGEWLTNLHIDLGMSRRHKTCPQKSRMPESTRPDLARAAGSARLGAAHSGEKALRDHFRSLRQCAAAPSVLREPFSLPQ